jgi:hypothetical protein
MNYLWHVFLNWTGASNTSGTAYGFWSGFGSDLGEAAIIGALLNHYRSHRCANCWRLGRHEVEGTHYRTCHRHLTNDDHALLQTRHEVLHPEQHAMLAGRSDG